MQRINIINCKLILNLQILIISQNFASQNLALVGIKHIPCKNKQSRELLKRLKVFLASYYYEGESVNRT
jgi:hypothetical protein